MKGLEIWGSTGDSTILVGESLQNLQDYIVSLRVVIITDKNVGPYYSIDFPPHEVIEVGTDESIWNLNYKRGHRGPGLKYETVPCSLQGREQGRGDKCPVIFSTEHKAGSPFRVLEIFAGGNIDLTRIKSIPNEPGNYVLFLDFGGSDKEDRVDKALDKLKKIGANFRMMDCYKDRKMA